MRRMTPAKLLVLIGKQHEQMGLRELPVASFACLYYNMNRSPGDKDKGTPEAPAREVADFQLFGKRKRTLASKDDRPGGAHVLGGAKADRAKWKAWVNSKSKRS